MRFDEALACTPGHCVIMILSYEMMLHVYTLIFLTSRASKSRGCAGLVLSASERMDFVRRQNIEESRMYNIKENFQQPQAPPNIHQHFSPTKGAWL